VGLAPILTILSVLIGLAIAWSSLQGLNWFSSHFNLNSALNPELDESAHEPAIAALAETPSRQQPWKLADWQGGFMLSSMLGNTGFVGLAIAPVFVDQHYLGWLVFYSVTQNVFGTYGLGVFLASFYGRRADNNHWWAQFRDVLTVPSLWAFAMGSLTHAIAFPTSIETGLHTSIWIVIPIALLLMGMRLSQLNGWQSLRWAILPATLKVVVLPALIGLVATLMHLESYPRLAMVLMSGMPSAFAGLILAEEYELDREIIASSIVVSTIVLLVTIPLWLFLFG
jgi:hypothetical protein